MSAQLLQAPASSAGAAVSHVRNPVSTLPWFWDQACCELKPGEPVTFVCTNARPSSLNSSLRRRRRCRAIQPALLCRPRGLVMCQRTNSLSRECQGAVVAASVLGSMVSQVCVPSPGTSKLNCFVRQRTRISVLKRTMRAVVLGRLEKNCRLRRQSQLCDSETPPTHQCRLQHLSYCLALKSIRSI